VPPPLLKAQSVYRCGGLTWSSQFDSGNLGAVRKMPRANGSVPNDGFSHLREDGVECDHEYELWSSPDCLGSETETQNRSWFHFSISMLMPGDTVRLRVVNLNVQSKLFAGGYTPVWRCAPYRPSWEPTKKAVTFGKGDYGFWIEWVFTLPSDITSVDTSTPLFFAFAVPYGTAEVEAKLRGVSEAFETNAELRESVYYHRSTLVRSCDGRAMPLLTLTSMTGRLDEQEGQALTSRKSESGEHTSLYPDQNAGPSCKFSDAKPIIFISARVHPAETMAQWMFDGILDFLLKMDDPRGESNSNHSSRCVKQTERASERAIAPLLRPAFSRHFFSGILE